MAGLQAPEQSVPDEDRLRAEQSAEQSAEPHAEHGAECRADGRNNHGHASGICPAAAAGHADAHAHSINREHQAAWRVFSGNVGENARLHAPGAFQIHVGSGKGQGAPAVRPGAASLFSPRRPGAEGLPYRGPVKRSSNRNALGRSGRSHANAESARAVDVRWDCWCRPDVWRRSSWHGDAGRGHAARDNSPTASPAATCSSRDSLADCAAQ